ncbi:Na+/H+ antiporter [Streptomyces bingchenggensis BCW-1]|uniref:Na+/H+ antiporter n=1 Tax=Streptomyces bingchenggensis (strain BCW-1) TaxID=749414 RepID=D7C9K2_STRBB|nr:MULTISPECIES: Na+/H+ antiporter [Streptomyces]ADI12714.1 Na+/H+ antiporter [Streptomyces bingchenggensis BCW-1]
MTGLELIVVVAATVLLMTWAARRLRLSEPLLLLIGGVLIGLMPRFGNVHLPPDVVLLLFLPALLYWESLTTSLREIKNNFRSIALQATGLVLVTAVAVALVAHALGYGWPIAFVLGAVLAPTDVAAVAAVAMAMPRRILTLLRTESLLNDGTALVLLAVGLELLTTGEPFSWTHTAVRFVEAYAGGAAIGAAIALLLIPVRRHLRDRVLHSGLSVATPFIAYLPAEALHVSGVLAVVTCGLVTSRVGPKVIGSDARMQATSFWEVTTFLLNGALFVLVGIETPAAIRSLTSISLLQAAVIAAVVSATVIAARVAWFYTIPYLVRLVDRRPRQRERRISARQRLPLAWAGMRGAISLAAALTIPTTTVDGRPLEQRDAVIFITVVVITVTLALLGPALPAVVRWARFDDDIGDAAEEALAVRHLASAARAEMPALAERLDVPRAATALIAKELDKQIAMGSGMTHDEEGHASRRQLSAVHALEAALLDIKRAALGDLRRQSRVDDIVLLRVQRYLDAEQYRLETRATLLPPVADETDGPPE